VQTGADGVDRLVVPVDDRLRACWRAAFEMVDRHKPTVIAPSCKALELAEPRPSPRWLESCRRYEAVAIQPPLALAQAAPRRDVPRARAPIDPTTIRLATSREIVPLERPRVLRVNDAVGDARFERSPLPSPPVPPYDLTAAAKQACGAVGEVMQQFAKHPTPELPLVVDARWNLDLDRVTFVWPAESEISPVEDALTSCLAGWTSTAAATVDGTRTMTWSSPPFAVELITSPERKLSISKR